jgi:hypothetical protein
MGNKFHTIIRRNSVFGWMALATGVLLLLPAAAAQFTNEMNWSAMDFALMGFMVFGAGSAFVIAARQTPQQYWGVIGFVCMAVLFFIWAELAVGVFTNLGN